MKYANIIVDISLEKLDKTFQYLVPEELNETLRPGMQVVIPFGSRKITGYILELTDTPEFDPARMKPILSLSEKAVPIEAQLIELAEKWNICFITIQAIQDYRKKHEKLVECVASPLLPTEYGEFRAYGYRNLLNGEHHVALVKGEIGDGENVLCRVHSECLTGDVFHSARCDCGQQLDQAMRQIEAEGRGILLYMRQEGRGIGLLNKLKAYELQSKGMDTVEANLALGFSEDMREYYIGAQILQDLGVKTLRLLTNNPDKVYQLSDFGMEIKERVPIEIPANRYDKFYLLTKKKRMGHLLDIKEAE